MKLFRFFEKYLLSPVELAKKKGVNIGANCKLNREVSFGSEPYLVTLGDNFYCSVGINFITHDGSVNVLRNIYPEFKNADIFGRITIGNNVFLGCNVTVLPNSKIGDNVIVGAGSIVKGKLDDGYVYAGVPAKKLFTIEKYKEKSSERITLTKSLDANQKKNIIESS